MADIESFLFGVAITMVFGVLTFSFVFGLGNFGEEETLDGYCSAKKDVSGYNGGLGSKNFDYYVEGNGTLIVECDDKGGYSESSKHIFKLERIEEGD